MISGCPTSSTSSTSSTGSISSTGSSTGCSTNLEMIEISVDYVYICDPGLT